MIGIGGSRVRALFRKELLDLSRNRAALLPVVVVTFLALILPFAITILIPAVLDQRLSDDADLVRLSNVVDPDRALEPESRIQLFLFQQFLLLFLLTPITGAMALASHSVVGEKQARTLEPLLAAPIGTLDLLVAKVLGALVPTLLIAFAGVAVYLAAVGLFAEPGVLGAMAGARTVVVVLLIGPASALVALQSAIIVSSRTNDPRTAQQFGVLIIVPLTALLVAQFAGALWLSAAGLAMVGVALVAAWVVLALISVVVFDREAILTRWR